MSAFSRWVGSLFERGRDRGLGDYQPPPDFICNAEIMDEQQCAMRDKLRQENATLLAAANRSLIQAGRAHEMAVNFDQFVGAVRGRGH